MFWFIFYPSFTGGKPTLPFLTFYSRQKNIAARYCYTPLSCCEGTRSLSLCVCRVAALSQPLIFKGAAEKKVSCGPASSVEAQQSNCRIVMSAKIC